MQCRRRILLLQRALAVFLLLIIIALAGCISQSNIKSDKYTENDLKLDKYSERSEDGRAITIYKTPNGSIRVGVVINTQPTDLGDQGLTDEVKHFVSNPIETDWNRPLQTFDIGGHEAASVRLFQVTGDEYRRPTNSVPDLYITSISYPEKNIILTIYSNGDSVNWEMHNEIVNRFMI